MEKQGNRPLHTEGTVSDYFVIEGHLLATRSADAYKAIDRLRNVPVMLWVMRHPLALHSEAVARFLERMQALDDLDPPLVEVSAFGVDSTGVAFAALPALDGFPVNAGNIEVAEAERRFTWCVRLMERLHEHRVVCGDLCGASFWVDRTGEVRFVGVMGSFDAEAAGTAVVPPTEITSYLAPEQRSGGGITAATDVYSLGVLGYFLITKSYPYADSPGGAPRREHLKKVSTLVATPPVWADEVLQRCLDLDPSKRYPDGAAVLRAIGEARSRVFAAESMPARQGAQPASAALPTRAAVSEPVLRHGATPSIEPPRPQTTPPPTPSQSSTSRMLLLGTVFIGVTAFLLFGPSNKPSATSHGGMSSELDPHRAVASSDELRQAIDAIEEESSLAKRSAHLEQMANSDDPLAHDILVKSASEAPTSELRAMSEQAIIERARRLGLLRSAEQVRQWLRTVREGQLPTGYEPILKSLDITLPMEARSSSLRQAYPAHPVLALRLAAALALDTNRLDEYQPLIAQFVGDMLRDEQAAERSSLGLILSHPELAMVFGDDAIQRRNQIPDGDLLWLAQVLANRNDINIRALANVAIERNILTPVQNFLLAVVRDRDDLESGVVQALVHAAAGAARPQDIAAFGRWYDLQSERVLLATLVSMEDAQLVTEAFDTLAGKSMSIEPGASLVSWVRAHAWDSRAALARSVGIVSNTDLVPEAEVRSAFKSFAPHIGDRRLVNVLLGAANPLLTRILIEQYADKLGAGGLLNLLDNPDPSVRMTAITHLRPYNDIAVLKVVLDYYEREKDPQVRERYRETFWVIKEREAKGK